MRRRAFILITLFAGATGSTLLSAQVTTKFRAEHDRLQSAARGVAIARHLTEAELLRNAISTPFVGPAAAKVQKVVPGSSFSVTVRGDFPTGTTFLSERDDVTISGAAVSTTTYSARLTIPPDEAPGFVRLFAITPVGIEGFAAVALVDTFYRFDLKASNGYTVKVEPVEKTFRITDNIRNVRAEVKYQAQFYKPGEAKPFETGTGDQTFYVEDAPHESHTPYARLDISFGQSTTSPEAEIEAISTKMNDPKTTDAERNALLVRMTQVQTKMMEEMAKALQTDPASLNKKQDDFGCGSMQLFPSKGGVVEGRIFCGQNFNGGEPLKVTGTMTQVR